MKQDRKLSAREFKGAVDPLYVVISRGLWSGYGHPLDYTLNSFAEANTAALHTDQF